MTRQTPHRPLVLKDRTRTLGPGRHDLNGLMGDVKADQALVVELALSAGPAVVWWVDLDTGDVSWMPGLDEMLGMPGADEQVVRTRLSELIAPLTIAARTAAVWQGLELEQQCEHTGGTVRRLQFRARISAGPPDRRSLVGITTDVSSRHEQRQALTDLTDRYRLLVDLSPDGIVVHEGGRIVYANPATVRFVRAASAAEVVGRPIVDFVHPDSVSAMLRRISELAAPGAATEPADAVLTRCDGGTVEVESVSVRTTWEGRPAFQVIMRDVTAQKAAAAALHYQAALVAHVSDALVARTSSGVVTSWNPSAELASALHRRSALRAFRRSAHGAHFAGRPAAEVEEVRAVALEAADVRARRHRQSLEHRTALRVHAAQLALVALPGAMPQLAIDEAHAGDEAVRFDRT
jgi:PAS domain S-box-containing protein